MAGGGQGANLPQAAQLQQLLQQQSTMGSTTPPVGMSNYASPNQSFMQYQGQGQPNQPDSVPLLTSQPPTVQNDGGPDAGASYAGNSMGFDGSGSDSGVGGQPVNQVQTPLQQGNKPMGLAQFRPQQGLQIAGNPTSQVVQRPQLR